MGQSGSVKHLKSLKYFQRKATYPSKSQLGESGDYKNYHLSQVASDLQCSLNKPLGNSARKPPAK